MSHCKPGQALSYPAAPCSTQIDDYFGTPVADPFRPLESDSVERRAWIESERKLTGSFLSALRSRTKLRHRLAELFDYEKYSLPVRKGKRTFYLHNSGLQNHSVLYMVDADDSQPRVLLDPNALSVAGTAALVEMCITDDGALMAYALSQEGSDWWEWRVRDIDSGKDLGDVLRWSKLLKVAWLKDKSGFFYSCYDPPKDDESARQEASRFMKLYFHTLGTPQAQDELIYQRPDQPHWRFEPSVTEDGCILIITVWYGGFGRNRLFYKDLTIDGEVIELLRNDEASYEVFDSDNTSLWLTTSLNAPRGRVIRIDLTKSAAGSPQIIDVIGQQPETLVGAEATGGQLFLHYLQDAHAMVKQCTLEGALVRKVALPGVGSVTGFQGSKQDKSTFFAFTSFLCPTTIYSYDIASGKSTVFKEPKLNFDPRKFVTKQVFATSKDGTRVPMFITYRKGLKRNGKNATGQYGYGGFNHVLSPTFSPSRIAWMEIGSIYAQVCTRGGGEGGEEWHEAGKRLKKQNVIDDFTAASEWLIENRYTSPKKLSIEGGSFGGALVGACMTQRPDLYGAVCPEVGLFDLLRFHRFTLGGFWTTELGCSEDKEEFAALYAYSPLHRVKPGTSYPAVLIMTADRDDRVVSGPHSYKFAAALQAAQASDAPVLIHIMSNAGHGLGTPTSKIIEKAVDKLAFLIHVLEVPARKWR